MGEHSRAVVHHGVHMVREGCQRSGTVVGFQAHRMERAEAVGAREGWTFTNVGPVRETHEAAWEDMWCAGDEFHDDGWTFGSSSRLTHAERLDRAAHG